ncbi:MAG: hypothetical protein ISS94_03560 [Candidatus Syntrophoarchaeum sp.]|nr:hypothetical protein [Candidatus Syntrophoarchaeum sp.]
MKIGSEILEEAKRIYLSGNSLRKTAKLIYQKHRINIGKETMRRYLKNVIKLRSKKECCAIKRGNALDEQKIAELYTKDFLSLKRIAKLFNASASGIRYVLIKNNIKIRGKWEGLRLAIGKYKKYKFNGTKEEKAYLMGITLGDAHVRRTSAFTIEVGVTSTRESLIKIFVNIFKKHTEGIIVSKDEKKGFRFVAYLDKDFDFLLKIKENTELIRNFKDEFLAFLTGFFDADGCIAKSKRLRRGLRYEIKIGNTNKELLEIIKEKLRVLEITSNVHLYNKKGKCHYLYGKKIVSRKNYYMLEISRREHVIKLLRMLDLKHEEKIARKMEAIKFLTSKQHIVNNYYHSTLYKRLCSLQKLLTVKEFAIKNNLTYYAALDYLLRNTKRGFIEKRGKRYVVNEKGKKFIVFYENCLKELESQPLTQPKGTKRATRFPIPASSLTLATSSMFL